MRNISMFVASLVLLATQVQAPFFGAATATAEPSAPAVGVHEVKLNTNTASPVEIVAQTKPDFDAEVLVPLRAAQAEAAAKVAAEAAAKKRVKVRTKTVTISAAVRAQLTASPENMLKLRLCEAGNIYARNSGNGYYGAYQFNIGTWNNYGGYARADLAPANVQDAKFLETHARRGWAPWPACSRKLGFM